VHEETALGGQPVTSITWPHGLERPVVPTSYRERPLPRTVRPCDPDLRRLDEQESVRPSHVAAWCVGGSIGWAAVIGAGWLVVEVVTSAMG